MLDYRFVLQFERLMHTGQLLSFEPVDQVDIFLFGRISLHALNLLPGVVLGDPDKIKKTGGVARLVQNGRSTFYCSRRQR